MRGKALVSLVLMTLSIHVFSQEPENDHIREAKYKNAFGFKPLMSWVDFIGGCYGNAPWYISYQRQIDRFGLELTLHDSELAYWQESYDDEVRQSEVELQVSYAPFWHFFNENNNICAYAYISSEWISEYVRNKPMLPFSISDYTFEYIHSGIGSELSLGHFSIYGEAGFKLILKNIPYRRGHKWIKEDFDLGIRFRF